MLYQSLNVAKDEVQLRQILACEFGSELNFQFAYFSLDDAAPKIGAISHAWEDDEGDFDIIVNGQIVSVARNV